MTYDWLRKVPGSLLQQDEIPLLGDIPSFPFEKFNEQLRKSLQNNSITVEASEPQWRTESDLFNGLGTPHKVIPLVVSSLDGKLFWAIAEEELSGLMGALLKAETRDSEYLEGFHHFIGLEALRAFRASGFDPRLSLQLEKESQAIQGPMLTVDVSISVNGSSFNGRLFIDTNLRRALKNFYSKELEKNVYKSPIADRLDAFVGVEIGKTTLTMDEWSKVAKGDLVLLDSCSLKPGDTKGRVTITYLGKPFFLAKLQEGSIKLSERPLYNEVNMATIEPDDEEEFEEEESEFEDEDEDEEDELEEEEGEEEEEDEDESIKEEAQSTVSTVPEEKKKTVKSPDEIPLNVVVEIARLQMPLKTLMNLQPGNLLDLNIQPENGVDLVVNGNRIARGELLQIGEKLGVRILDK